MEGQLDLIDLIEGRARKRDPETSKEAARKADAVRISRSVLRTLRTGGPLTTEEIALLLRRPIQSITPRMVPLELQGKIRRTGSTRKGISGRARILWEAVPDD